MLLSKGMSASSKGKSWYSGSVWLISLLYRHCCLYVQPAETAVQAQYLGVQPADTAVQAQYLGVWPAETAVSVQPVETAVQALVSCCTTCRDSCTNAGILYIDVHASTGILVYNLWRQLYKH